MPNKQPDIWTWLYFEIFLNYKVEICGMVIAFIVSLSHSFLYGKKDSWSRVLVEALLCAILAGVARPVLESIGLNINLITPIGAGIGLIGTSVIRRSILVLLKRKIESEPKGNDE